MTSRARQRQDGLVAGGRNRLGRAALFLAMVFLTIQLFCLAFHRHALTEQVSDCVSCYSASQLSGGTPIVALPIAAPAVAMYRQPLLQAVSRLVLASAFRTPPAPAPPAIS